MVVSVYVASKYQIDVIKQVLLFYLPKIKPEFSAKSLWCEKIKIDIKLYTSYLWSMDGIAYEK